MVGLHKTIETVVQKDLATRRLGPRKEPARNRGPFYDQVRVVKGYLSAQLGRGKDQGSRLMKDCLWGKILQDFPHFRGDNESPASGYHLQYSFLL